MTMYSGDDFYDDDITSGPLDRYDADQIDWVHETIDSEIDRDEED